MHVDHILYLDELPADCIHACSRSGACDDAVAFWRKHLDFTVDRERAVETLVGYGAWDRAELAAASDERLAERILWLACCDFNEWDGSDDSVAGSDIFFLGI